MLSFSLNMKLNDKSIKEEYILSIIWFKVEILHKKELKELEIKKLNSFFYKILFFLSNKFLIVNDIKRQF